jgi:hypothetical protein
MLERHFIFKERFMDYGWFRKLKQRQAKKEEERARRIIDEAAAEGRLCGERLRNALVRTEQLDAELAVAMASGDRPRVLELAPQIAEAIAEFRAAANFEAQETSRLGRISESLKAILRNHGETNV